MKPILRELRTGLYFQGGATWSDNPSDALVYSDIESALEAAYSSPMPGLELNVLFFEDPRYTIRLALDEFFCKVDGKKRSRIPPWNEPWLSKERRRVEDQGSKALERSIGTDFRSV